MSRGTRTRSDSSDLTGLLETLLGSPAFVESIRKVVGTVIERLELKIDLSNKLIKEQSEVIQKQANIIKELKDTVAAVSYNNNKFLQGVDTNSVPDKADIVSDKGNLKKTQNLTGGPIEPDRHTFNNKKPNSIRTQPNRRAIEGKKLITSELVASAIQAAIRPNPPKLSIHVFRLSPTVSENDIKGYLNQAFPSKPFAVEKLNARSDWYSSFKIDSDFDIGSSLLAAEFWPQGVLVRRFIPGKKPFLTGVHRSQPPPGQILQDSPVELD